jgi:hypothetical protein
VAILNDFVLLPGAVRAHEHCVTCDARSTGLLCDMPTTALRDFHMLKTRRKYARDDFLGFLTRHGEAWMPIARLTANYTWAHSLDNLSSTFSEIYGGQSGVYYLGYLDGFNPKLDYGNSDYDIRQRFVLSGTWELPWLKHASNSIVRGALGGWGIGSILNIRTGMPFSIFDCTNFNGTSCPQYVSGQAIASSGTPVAAGSGYSANLFNYITLPNAGGLASNLGNSLGMPVCTGLDHSGCTYTADGSAYPDRNQFVGPGYWNADMNFYKNFKLTERFQLQFRGEFYNIFNHHNQYVTGLNLDASSLVDVNGNPSPYIQTEKGGIYGYAGQSSDERRNIQFGLRLTF